MSSCARSCADVRPGNCADAGSEPGVDLCIDPCTGPCADPCVEARFGTCAVSCIVTGIDASVDDGAVLPDKHVATDHTVNFGADHTTGCAADDAADCTADCAVFQGQGRAAVGAARATRRGALLAASGAAAGVGASSRLHGFVPGPRSRREAPSWRELLCGPFATLGAALVLLALITLAACGGG